MHADFNQRIAFYQTRIERVLDRCLELPNAGPDSGTARLREGMRYSVLGGGKRLRPTLVYTSGESLGVPLEQLDAPAAAVELIHVYSLVHDDLPAMDNDDLRRGRPTCHRAFDEATAILVGDALQALAFDVIADDTGSGVPANARLEMIQVLARAIGTSGMAGGQAIDLAAVGRTLTLEELERMHRLKTGALIEASVMLGAIASPDNNRIKRDALKKFATAIGLAFQIQDDILDVEGTVASLGKTPGADAAKQKPTYPSITSLDFARTRARELRDEAVQLLAPLGEHAKPLADLAHFVVSRAH